MDWSLAGGTRFNDQALGDLTLRGLGLRFQGPTWSIELM